MMQYLLAVLSGIIIAVVSVSSLLVLVLFIRLLLEGFARLLDWLI